MRNIVIDTIRSITSLPRGRRITVLLIAANIVLPILYLTGVSPASVWGKLNPQNRKRVQRVSGPPNEPLEVSEPKFQATPIALGQPFDSTDVDWIKGLTFKIKNRSNKPITFIHLDVLFPETRATGPVLVHQLFLGQRDDLRSTLVNNPPLELMPGKQEHVSLEPAYARIKRLIEHKHKVGDIHDIDIEVYEVMFADGTLWAGGIVWKRNPDISSPHKWVRAGSDEQ